MQPLRPLFLLFLFRSTDQIKADYPQIPAYETYDELLAAIRAAL